MRNKKDTIFLIFFLILLAISFKFMGDTFARYVDVYDGKTRTEVAAWAFEGDNLNEVININLLENTDSTKLINGRVAPGSSGTFKIKVSNKNSEVSIEYNIELDQSSIPSNLVITNPDIQKGTLKYGEEKDLTFNWEWQYYEDDLGDEEDTGYIGNDLILSFTVTGKQLINNQ